MAEITIDPNGNIVDPASFASAPARKQTKKERHDIIGLKQFDKVIPDESAAIAFIEEKIWGDTPFCGHCGGNNAYRVASGRPMSHRCRDCRKYFSVRTNTVMAETNLPLRKWLLAIHLIHTSRKGMSAMQLHKMLDVTYKTAWFLCHRIREGMTSNRGVFTGGIVEIDETYVGGKWNRMHDDRRKALGGNPMANKMIVMGFKDRDTGRIVAFPIEHTTAPAMEGLVAKWVEPGVEIHTDGASGYANLSLYGYDHDTVNHSVGQYVKYGYVTTNGIEGFWGLLKRGYVGTFHYMSWKHLHRYVNEFAYRTSSGVGNGFNTIGGVLGGMKGKRLTYATLIAS